MGDVNKCVDSGKYVQNLMGEIDNCNEIVKKMCKSAYAFETWTPYVFACSDEESAFSRDVVNYYSLLKECSGYMWNDKDDIYLNFLDSESGVRIKNYKKSSFFEQLREMRTFLCHRYDKASPDFFCGYINFIGAGTLKDYESKKIIAINNGNVDWAEKRKELYDKMRQLLRDYYQALSDIARNGKKEEKFAQQWKEAVARWYTSEYGKLKDIGKIAKKFEKFVLDNGCTNITKLEKYVDDQIEKKYNIVITPENREKNFMSVIKWMDSIKGEKSYELYDMYWNYLDAHWNS